MKEEAKVKEYFTRCAEEFDDIYGQHRWTGKKNGKPPLQKRHGATV